MGIPYDSDAGRGICGALDRAAQRPGLPHLAARSPATIGPFAGYKDNEQPMLDVMQMHRDAVEKIDPACPAYLRTPPGRSGTSASQSGRRYGYRNAQATVLAPTGTIAFMMDCDTTGIEPDIALVKYKQLAGGGMMKIINRTVPRGAQDRWATTEPQIEGDPRATSKRTTRSKVRRTSRPSICRSSTVRSRPPRERGRSPGRPTSR